MVKWSNLDSNKGRVIVKEEYFGGLVDELLGGDRGGDVLSDGIRSVLDLRRWNAAFQMNESQQMDEPEHLRRVRFSPSFPPFVLHRSGD